MIITDMWTEKRITLQQLKNDYNELKKSEPLNHAEDFKTEYYILLMDTINGRNDIELSGLVPKEISNIIIKLRRECIK